MLKLACVAVFVVLLGAAHSQAVPACVAGCTDNYCDSTCHTNNDNILYTISKTYGTGKAKCTPGSETSPCPDSIPEDFDFSTCQAQCKSTDDCVAFIKDQDFVGDRCKFLKSCMSAEDAGDLVPCEECTSQRTCTSCPKFVYGSGSTMVHWLCEMRGDAYTSEAAEGTYCTPSAKCVEGKPSSITCKAAANIEDPGQWINTETQEAVESAILADSACECGELRIPAEADTNLFCEKPHDVNVDSNSWTLSGTDKCDLVCDASVFIPIECRFNTDTTAASWHINFSGSDVDLEGTDCLACSLNNCKTDGTTNPAPTTTTVAPAPTTTTVAPTTTTTVPEL